MLTSLPRHFTIVAVVALEKESRDLKRNPQLFYFDWSVLFSRSPAVLFGLVGLIYPLPTCSILIGRFYLAAPHPFYFD